MRGYRRKCGSRASRACAGARRLARGLPAVGCHAEERLNIRGTVKVDRLLDMADRDVAEALIRRLLDLVGIGFS